MSNLLGTVGGYVAVLGAGGLYYWYYVQRPNRGKQTPRRGPTPQEQVKQKKQSERKKNDKSYTSDQGTSDAAAASSVAGSGREQVKDRKKGKQREPNGAASSAVDTSPATERSLGKDEDDNRAFAAQLAKTQQGTTLKATEKDTKKMRTTKQGKANKVAEGLASATESSTPPSTTGADADDDMSPHLSPELAAIKPTSDPTGVADMIEEEAPGPSTLRIVPSNEPARQQKTKPAKKEAEVETKKQRRARQKNEERKAEAAEAEKSRKAAMERQMKTARTLDGTAKSHVSKFTAPPESVWAKSNGEEKKEPEPVAPQAELLDTIDPTPTAEKPEPVKELKPANGAAPAINGSITSNGVNSTTAVSTSSSDVNDEWEQVPKEALQSDDGWQEAPSKKAKKNKKKAEATATEAV